MPAELQIGVVNTVSKELPSELMGLELDDPLVINKFKRALDTVFHYMPDLELHSLNIGNESDVYFDEDQEGYQSLKTFLDEVAPYAKQLYMDLHGEELLVGTTFTLDGILDPNKSAFCQEVNASRDVITTTYYPLTPTFQMKPPSVVFEDFDGLVELYPNTPIHFAECGYATSADCSSDESMQADFYSNVFAAWDQHIDHIDYISFFQFTDWPQDLVDELGVYYGIDDISFLEYLRTLGVRNWSDGSNKEAWDRIFCELEARDWCDLPCETSIAEANNNNNRSWYPNPASDQIAFAKANITAEIYDLTGKLITQKTPEENYFDVADLPPGLYVICITDGTEVRSDRLVIQ